MWVPTLRQASATEVSGSIYGTFILHTPWDFMPSYIKHRINKLSELHELGPGLGAEIDLRTYQDEIILRHDPFGTGDRLEDYLKVWASKKDRGTLILNTKEDQLEPKALELLKREKITDFFFLDTSLPSTVKLAIKEKMPKLAIRVSDYEPVEAAMKFAGRANWIWLDCFSGKPPTAATLSALNGIFRLCLVSPELHAFPPETRGEFYKIAREVDAVCTKDPDGWKEN